MTAVYRDTTPRHLGEWVTVTKDTTKLVVAAGTLAGWGRMYVTVRTERGDLRRFDAGKHTVDTLAAPEGDPTTPQHEHPATEPEPTPAAPRPYVPTVHAGRVYRMASMHRAHPSYPVRRTVLVDEVDAEGRVWFTCPTGERRYLPAGEFANQYFETEGCDLPDDAEQATLRAVLAARTADAEPDCYPSAAELARPLTDEEQADAELEIMNSNLDGPTPRVDPDSMDAEWDAAMADAQRAHDNAIYPLPARDTEPELTSAEKAAELDRLLPVLSQGAHVAPADPALRPDEREVIAKLTGAPAPHVDATLYMETPLLATIKFAGLTFRTPVTPLDNGVAIADGKGDVIIAQTVLRAVRALVIAWGHTPMHVLTGDLSDLSTDTEGE